jgi:hypothetical protein
MRRERHLLLVGAIALSACNPGGGTGETSATVGGPGSETTDPGGEASTADAPTTTEGTDGTSGPSGTGSDGVTSTADTGDTGGPPPAGACPIDQYPEDRQVLFESSGMTIYEDTVWTKDNLYIITEEVGVDAVLTIEAGTTVCFGSDINIHGKLDVRPFNAGGLRVTGTADEHVTFTALDEKKGWSGVYVSGAEAVVDLAYADFVHASDLEIEAGFWSFGALRIRAPADEPPVPARLHNVTFSGLKRGGALWLEGPVTLSPDSSIRVDAYDLAEEEDKADSAVLVSLQAASSLAPGMITLGPEIPEQHRGIQPLSDTLSEHSTLHPLEWPYLAKRGIFVLSSSNYPDKSLTIEAGVEIRLGAGAVIQAGTEAFNRGDLIVAGTAEAPVRMSYYPFPDAFTDHWGALFFATYDPTVSRVSHAVLENAGFSTQAEVNDACGDNSTAAIVLSATALKNDWQAIAIDHTTITGSASNGIVAECSGGCVDATLDYTDPALANMFVDIAGAPQILATCP